jgi:ferric-dicitrate binding protein FerR (iron transport regulator)
VGVNNGEEESILLGDSSIMLADAGRYIQYAENYGEHSRDIKLVGQAYFEVRHIPDIPFRVYSGNGMVEVLGTKFNVRSWTESETISVSVIDGKVSFGSSDGENKVLIEKGFKSELNKDGSLTQVSPADTTKILSWLNGEIYFEDTGLAEVLAQIERWYDVRINISDNSIKSERLSVYINNHSLPDNLNLISRLTSTKYTIDNKIITFIPLY